MKFSGFFCPIILLCLMISYGLTGDVFKEYNDHQIGKTHQCGWRRYSKITLDERGTDKSALSSPKRASFNDTRSGPDSVISMVFYGEQLIDRTQNPWIVRIITTIIDPVTGTTRALAGSGFIIGRHWILTAAHIACNTTTWEPLQLSQHRIIIAHNTSIPSQMDLNISKVIVHEGVAMRDGLVWNDIALFRLVHPLNYTPEVQPICLPKIFSESDKCTNLSSTDEELAREEARAEVVGYGRTEFSAPRSPLNYNDTRWPVEIANRGLMRFMCPEFYQQLFPQSKTNDSGPTWEKYHRLCLYNTNYSKEAVISNGDSGGPALMCPLVNENGTMERCYSIGVLSAGGRPITAMPEFNYTWGPAEYMRVTRYCDWIENKTGGQVRCEQSLDGAEGDENYQMPALPLPPPFLPINANISDILEKFPMPTESAKSKESIAVY